MAETDEAAMQLSGWDCNPTVAVRHLPVCENLFSILWDRGFFTSINQTCGLMIDDYEEEELEPKHLDGALLVVHRHLKLLSDQASQDFLRNLEDMIIAAKHQQRCIYFIL